MIKPGSPVPALDLPLTNGSRFNLAEDSPEHFTLLIFFRGKHCPICKNQLVDLSKRLSDYAEAGVTAYAISMDDEERAMDVAANWGTGDVPLAHGLTEAQAREWGLYITEGREGTAEPAIFSEPGMFLVRADKTLYFASIQNAPFTRPPLGELLQGIQYVTQNDYPTRGTLT